MSSTVVASETSDLDDDPTSVTPHAWVFTGMPAGSYTFTEDTLTGWDLTNIECTGDSNAQTSISNRTAVIDLSGSEDVTCTFTNTKKGNVIVYKFNDLNADGNHDEGEPYLPDWSIYLNRVTGNRNSQDTDASGSVTFSVSPGDYALGETIQEGWTQSNIYCEGDEQNPSPTPSFTPTPTGEASPTVTPSITLTPTATKTPTPTPMSTGGLCHWEGRDGSWNALPVDFGNPGHADHPLDYPYDGPRDPNGHPSQPAGDAWCAENAPQTSLPAFIMNKILGVSTVFAATVSNYLNGYPITVEPGMRKVCYIGNYQKGKIIVKKNVVGHTGGEVDDTTVFTVTGDQGLGAQPISEGSPHTFADLNPGTYTFTETGIPSGYTFQNVTGDEDPNVEGAQVTVTSGSETTITFINKKSKPAIYIRKFNDKWPTPQNTGAEILYTIVVSIRDAGMNDVHMIDLPPNGFKYKNGSWKAYISHNGGPTLPYSVAQPAYASPGTWFLGNLAKDDVVTLTYIATIAGDKKPGIYKDLAWAYGCSESATCSVASADKLLASSEDSTKTDPGIITDNLVGTKIEIPKIGTPSNTINILEKREVGSVLGASTQRLPATGANDWALIVGLFNVLMGMVLGSLYISKKHMRKILSKTFVAVAVMFAATAIYASVSYAADVVVRVNEPKTPAYEGFDLGFVALDIAQSGGLSATCTISNSKGVKDFATVSLLEEEGNSGICKVDTGLLAEGDNTLKVTVNGASDSTVVKYVPSSSGPGTPRNYDRYDLSSCEKKITFLTADDGGKTVRVEVYRGESTEFTLNDGTKVATFNIGSNTNGTHTEIVPDCNKKYYYALRAFDAAGNPSGVVGDRVYENVTTSTTGGTTETIGQAQTDASGAVIVSESSIPAERGGAGGQVLGEGTDKLSITPEATPEGKVLGEETTPMTEKVTEAVNNRGIWAVAGGVLLLFGVLYFVYRRWTGRDIPPTK